MIFLFFLLLLGSSYFFANELKVLEPPTKYVRYRQPFYIFVKGDQIVSVKINVPKSLANFTNDQNTIVINTITNILVTIVTKNNIVFPIQFLVTNETGPKPLLFEINLTRAKERKAKVNIEEDDLGPSLSDNEEEKNVAGSQKNTKKITDDYLNLIRDLYVQSDIKIDKDKTYTKLSLFERKHPDIYYTIVRTSSVYFQNKNYDVTIISLINKSKKRVYDVSFKDLELFISHIIDRKIILFFYDEEILMPQGGMYLFVISSEEERERYE